MSEYLLAITTLGKEADAVRLARALVERRLAACVNVVPSIRSIYRWKDAVEDEGELLLLMKTRAERYDALAKAVAELHPYEVPELIALPVATGSPAYLAWIDGGVTADSRGGSG